MMKKLRIKYTEEYTPSPLSYWVHEHLDSDSWHEASEYEPALPKAIPCKGFPVLLIEGLGVELQFSSIEEVHHFLEIISQKNMPTSLQLSQKRNTTYGPNGHWLSRLPAKLKSWNKREKLIPLIKEGLIELEAVYQ